MHDHAVVPEPARASRQRCAASPQRPCVILTRLALRCLPLAALVLLAGCAQETLFQSNFNATPVGQPPAQAQQVGTANVFGPAGSVVVVGPPTVPSSKWVQISRAARLSEVAGMQGNFSQSRPTGTYTFSSFIYMPSNSGLATVQFEPFGQPVSSLSSFLHLDFTQDNRVRLDDNDATKFGSFPRDQVFLVQVTLNTAASPPTAHIVLSGAGASGQADYVILPPFRPLAQQFGAVRLWMGFPWTGTFDATNIVVSRNTQ